VPLGVSAANLDGIHEPFPNVIFDNEAVDHDMSFVAAVSPQGVHSLRQIRQFTADQDSHITLLAKPGQDDGEIVFRSGAGRRGF
jgi:hypothetical protein